MRLFSIAAQRAKVSILTLTLSVVGTSRDVVGRISGTISSSTLTELWYREDLSSAVVLTSVGVIRPALESAISGAWKLNETLVGSFRPRIR